VPENVGTAPKGCPENSVCAERRSESRNPRIESGLRSSVRLDLEQSIEIYGIVATAVGPDDEDVPSIGEQRPSLGDRDDDTQARRHRDPLFLRSVYKESHDDAFARESLWRAVATSIPKEVRADEPAAVSFASIR